MALIHMYGPARESKARAVSAAALSTPTQRKHARLLEVANSQKAREIDFERRKRKSFERKKRGREEKRKKERLRERVLRRKKVFVRERKKRERTSERKRKNERRGEQRKKETKKEKPAREFVCLCVVCACCSRIVIVSRAVSPSIIVLRDLVQRHQED